MSGDLGLTASKVDMVDCSRCDLAAELEEHLLVPERTIVTGHSFTFYGIKVICTWMGVCLISPLNPVTEPISRGNL